MIIYSVPNMHNLMRTLDACQENVEIVTPDGQVYAWHEQDPGMLRTVFETQCCGLEIRCKNKNDTVRLVTSAMSNWPKKSAIA